MKTIFLSWERYHRRSEILAQYFNASIFNVTYGKKGKLLDTIIKYPTQTLQTWKILRKEKPAVIFVQNPPIFCALVAYIYGCFFGSVYIIDSHTGAFLDLKWRIFLGLHRWLSRRALTTIVHNKSQEKIVKEWKCSYCVIGFTPGTYPEGEPYQFTEQLNIAVVSAFLDDEPLSIIFAAACLMPEVGFYITGDDRQMVRHLRETKPENCHLTGYLSYVHYVGLLRGADAVMDLTTRDNTLLMGGFEAISLEKPLIVSDWPILRDYFKQGTVFVSNDIEGISEGIYRVKLDQASLQHEIVLLHKLLFEEWKHQISELQEIIYRITTND